MESYMETLMAEADGPRRAQMTVLQQINANLTQNFQQQNQRLEQLERIAAAIERGGLSIQQPPPLRIEAVEAIGQEQLEQPVNPENPATESRRPRMQEAIGAGPPDPQVPPERPNTQDGSVQGSIVQEGSVRSGRVLVPEDRVDDSAQIRTSAAESLARDSRSNSPDGGSVREGQSSRDKNQDAASTRSSNKPQTQALPSAPPPPPPKTAYLDPSPTLLSYPALFTERPYVQRWLQENLWIPSDRRMPLTFDVDALNSMPDLSQVKEIGMKLHNFNAEITSNLGRFFIIDNFNQGNNRIFGNDIKDKPFVHCRPTDNVRHTWTVANNVLADPEALKTLSALPVMVWNSYEDPPAAPWRRAIIFEGIAEIVSKNVKDYHAVVDGFFASGPLIAENPILTHLNSRQSFYERMSFAKYGTAAQPTTSWVGKHVLHYSWFTLYPDKAVRSKRRKNDETLTDLPHHCFLAGPLYSDPQHRWLGRSNTTIQLHFSMQQYTSEPERMRDYTILVMRPPSNIDVQTDTPYLAGQVSMIHHSAFVLERIAIDAKEIADYLEEMLAIGDNFLYDPTGHDKLLFDDDTFSSSRKYWWATDMLSTIRPHIDECIRAHNGMYNDLIWPLKRTEPLPYGLHQADLRAGQAFGKLKDLLKRFAAQQIRVETLRSGVFNASGVVESRASTRFGEIVRLLTYVSIFYLPLSFSISLWQTTPFFSEQKTGILFTVMAVVGFITYFTTLNLDNIVHFCDNQYQVFKAYMLRSMSKEGGVWANRAFMYSGFRPRTQNSTPSEWWVFWYAVTFLLRPSTWKRMPGKKKEAQKGSHVRTSTWTSVIHPQSGKNFVIPEDDGAGWMEGFPSSEGEASDTLPNGVAEADDGISVHDQAMRATEDQRPSATSAMKSEKVSPLPRTSVKASDPVEPSEQETESSWFRRLFSPNASHSTQNDSAAAKSETDAEKQI